VSAVVMDILGRLSPVCEPISLDECFVDLAAAGGRWDSRRVRAVAAELKAAVHAATGLRASVGAGTSKLVAKIASDLDKPDGLLIVAPGDEMGLLGPLPIRRIWSVGPATEARLRQIGVHTISDLAAADPDDLVALLGSAHGRLLARLARAEDTRAVSAHREAKSISVEDTFERDLVDRATLTAVVDRMSAVVGTRLREAGLSARTVTVKARRPDFATLTRSSTLPGPSDESRVIATAARRLLAAIDTTDGLRLLGVGVSGLTDWTQQDLFDPAAGTEPEAPAAEPEQPAPGGRSPGHWVPGQDVFHRSLGPGWVWGAGLGRVTVRFETRESTAPGPVRTFAAADPELGAVHH
jgi:DNA polymerase IV